MWACAQFRATPPEGTEPKLPLVDHTHGRVRASAGTRLLVSDTRRLPKRLTSALDDLWMGRAAAVSTA